MRGSLAVNERAGRGASRAGGPVSRRGGWRRRPSPHGIAVVGVGELARQVVARLRRVRADPPLVGVFLPVDGRRDAETGARRASRGLDELERLIKIDKVDEVIVALPRAADELLAPCLERLRALPVELWMLPDVALLDRGAAAQALPLIQLARRPQTDRGRLVKLVLDRIIASLLLALLGPLMLLIAGAIRLDSRGPALFRQERVGRNRVLFPILKFRTMRTEREAWAVPAGRGDQRVTRIGRLLRRTSLDELPQLLNVLRGEMSLVGPRPYAVLHDRTFARLIEGYDRRHRVRPGITGLAQIKGLRGEPENLEALAARLRLDLAYIDDWSPWLDCKILLHTLRTPFSDAQAF